MRFFEMFAPYVDPPAETQANRRQFYGGIENYVRSVPDKTGTQLAHDAGYGLEKVAETVAVSKGANLVKGAIAGEAAMAESGLNFATTPAKHMSTPSRYVPVQLIDDVVKNTKGFPDPKGSKAMMHYSQIEINQKSYNLEVLYDKKSNTIYHFEYKRDAMGPLPQIKK